MNEKEIIEGNKLIAEFMELKVEWKEYPNSQLNRWEVDKDRSWMPMEYNSSWDWWFGAYKKYYQEVILEDFYEHADEKILRELESLEVALHAANLIAAFKYLVSLIKYYNTLSPESHQKSAG